MNEYFKNVNTGAELNRDEYFKLMAKDVAEYVVKIADEIVEDSDEDTSLGEMFEALSERIEELYDDPDFDHYIWDDDNQHYVNLNWGRC